MSVSASQSTPIVVPETSQRTIEPLEPNRYEKALMRFGLYEKAQRSALCRNAWEHWKAERPDGTLIDNWRKPKFTLMLRTDGWKAQDLTDEQENTYHRFAEQVGATFTVLSFRFLAKPAPIKTPIHQHNQGIVRDTRKVIDRFLPVSLDKVGAMDDKFERYNRVVKVLYAGAVDGEQHKAIQAELPEGVTLQHRVYDRAAFHAQFLLLLAPDLPRDDFERAGFEAFLTRMVQIQLHKVPAKVREQFAYTPEYVYANQDSDTAPAKLSDGLGPPVYCEEHKKFHRQRIPRSPKTGAYATHVSVVVDASTKFDDILPDEWIKLPDPDLTS